MAPHAQSDSLSFLASPPSIPRLSVSPSSPSSTEGTIYVQSRYFEKDADVVPNPQRSIPSLLSPPITPAKSRMIKTEDFDVSASDSALSDPPTDLECPFPDDDPLIFGDSRITPRPKIKRRFVTTSPYFSKKPKKQISCLPFPPTTTETFGLMQEKLAQDPFRMLVATIFLNRTRGEQAMPVYFELMERYPKVSDLAAAQLDDVVAIIHKLGFQNQRARKCVALAKAWLQRAPMRGKRYRKLDYPRKGDGRDVGADESVEDDDTRTAWEVAGLPGIGGYALDSWRIFCRDKLRGLATSWNGEGSKSAEFEPEWTRVIPTDKELRAYLAWMWLKRGYIWNKETGERRKADTELLDRAQKGGIVREDTTDWILVSPTRSSAAELAINVTKPAGSFIPEPRARSCSRA